MKNAYLFVVATTLLTACGRNESAKDTTAKSATVATDSVAASPPKNCQSIAEANKLGKPLLYEESAKPVKFTLTLNQDTGTMETANGCYFNNTITILAIKKSGKQLFKRTLSKDDLNLFAKNDAIIQKSILQNVTYKATFNGERYFNLTMRLIEPVGRKTTSYTLFMNYFGEIVKVRQAA